jgi:hypothetical protein
MSDQTALPNRAGDTRSRLDRMRERAEFAEAEIERLEQLLVIARSGLRSVRPYLNPHGAQGLATAALLDSDPGKRDGV